MQAVLANWKTTVLGIGVIAAAIAGFAKALADGDPATVADPAILVAEVTAGVALIFARDANKSSEVSGAK